jgi:hypothetical protein
MQVAWGVVPLPGDEYVATSPNLSHSILLPYTVTTVKRNRKQAPVHPPPDLSAAQVVTLKFLRPIAFTLCPSMCQPFTLSLSKETVGILRAGLSKGA